MLWYIASLIFQSLLKKKKKVKIFSFTLKYGIEECTMH